MNRTRLLGGLVCMSACLLAAGLARGQDQAPVGTVAATSPNGKVRIVVVAGEGTAGALHYQVNANNRPIILDSSLNVVLAGGRTLGTDCAIEGVTTRKIDDTYRQYPGKRSTVVNRCSETVVSVREHAARGRQWQLVLCAYDDGVAFRFRFPAQQDWTSLEVAEEKSSFTFPNGTSGYALPLNSFTTSFEQRYAHKLVSEIPADWLLGLPFLVEVPGAGWAAVTEANLTDYAGMYLAHERGNGQTMRSRLSPLPSDDKIAVRSSLPHDSPWRVVMIGENPGRLLESDLLLNLNEPSAIDDVSWIHPGRTTFPWWNGFYEKDVPFKPGLNTATAKYYIDFCAEAHIPYHSLDGVGNVAWYGGPIVPYQGADIVQGVAGLDLPEVLRYAKEKGVRIRTWMHWGAARAHMTTAFPLYQKWGIEGVMIDFMNRDDQEMVNFMRDVLRTAAANHLTVTFHGVCKPTGLERTYPNLLTSEGAMNYEYDKWDPIGIPPEHDLTLVFTRMLAGPMDFHQGCLRGVPVSEFKPRNDAPLVMGTPCRMLATYVVFQNHLSMAADYPSAYRGNPGLPVLASIPATWDDTKVLVAEVGKVAVVARRHGDDWWIGAMSDREARELSIPMEFLMTRRFHAAIYRDEPSPPYRMASDEQTIVGSDSLHLKLAPAGGAVVHLMPADR